MTERTRYAKGQIQKPQMRNKLESDFGLILEARKQAREIRDYSYELITFKLGPDCRYTPDFAVMAADDVFEFYEVKGYEWAKNMVKLRMAAGRLPFRFFLCQRDKGEWSVVRFQL